MQQGPKHTSSESLNPSRSTKASFTVVGYGPEVKRFRGDLELSPSDIDVDRSIEVARDCG
jgi:hypothetical protein